MNWFTIGGGGGSGSGSGGGSGGGGGGGGGGTTNSSPYIAYRQLRQIKVKLAVDRCVEQIPFRLCHKIQQIRFGPEGVVYPTFEVVYMGGKVVEFDNVDSFPTDADIARIALECP